MKAKLINALVKYILVLPLVVLFTSIAFNAQAQQAQQVNSVIAETDTLQQSVDSIVTSNEQVKQADSNNAANLKSENALRVAISANINIIRRPLKNYKENGVPKPNTGIINVVITGGTGSYSARLYRTPLGSSGRTLIKEFTATDGDITEIKDIDAGTYTLEYKDGSATSWRTITSDPVNYIDTLPPDVSLYPGYGFFFSSSMYMKQSQHNWVFVTIKYNDSSFINQSDISPYFTKDNLGTYFEYGWGTYTTPPTKYYSPNIAFSNNETDAFQQVAQHNASYPGDQVTTFVSKGHTALLNSANIYYKLPSDIDYRDLCLNNENYSQKPKSPVLYWRVKGSDDSRAVKVAITRSYPDESGILKAVMEKGLCSDDYKIRIKVYDDSHKLYNLPMNVHFLRNPNGSGTGTRQDNLIPITITGLEQSGNYKPGRWIDVTAINPSVDFDPNIYWTFCYYSYDKMIPAHISESYVYLPPQTNQVTLHLFKTTNLARPGCEGDTNYPFDFSLSLAFSREIDCNGMQVKITRAPSGFLAATQMQLNHIYTVTGGKHSAFELRDLYPSGLRSIPYRPGCKGDYEIQVKFPDCPDFRAYNITLNDDATPYVYVFKPENFKPKLKRVDCGKVRLYPFPEGSKNILYKKVGNQLTPVPIYLRVSGYPQALGITPSNPRYGSDGITVCSGATNYKYKDIFSGRRTDLVMHTGIMNGDESRDKDFYIEFNSSIQAGNFQFEVLRNDIPREYGYVLNGYPLCDIPPIVKEFNSFEITYELETYLGSICDDTHSSGILRLKPINIIEQGTESRVNLYVHNINASGTESTEWTKINNGNYISIPKGQFLDLKLESNPSAYQAYNAKEGRYFIPSTYRIGLIDPYCSSTVEHYFDVSLMEIGSLQKLLDNSSTLRYCPTSPISLKAREIPKASYTWTSPKGTVYNQRIVDIPAEEALNNAGQWTLRVTNVPCTPTERSASFFVSVAPQELWWNRSASNANWNDLNNWVNADGTAAKAIPWNCTNVHLPASVLGKFPDLTRTDHIDLYGNPECVDIFFHYGSRLGAPQELIYQRAFIDYNFGVMNNGSVTANNTGVPADYNNVLLQRNRWYMLAVPIKNVYAGDFGLAGKPMTYSRYINTFTVEGSALTTASFSKSFNNLNTPLSSLEHYQRNVYNALALKVAGYDAKSVGYKEQNNLNLLNGIIRLPFYEDATRSKAYPLHKYDKGTHQSTMWYFSTKTLAPINRSEVLARSADNSDYRFVFEGMVVESDPNAKYYRIDLSNDLQAGEWILVGNPFMTPIDFSKLYAGNSDLLEKYFYIYEDNANGSAGSWHIYTGGVIPPMQSVLLRINKNYSKPYKILKFYLNGPNKVLLSPNESLEIYPKRAESVLNNQPLTISAYTSHGLNASAYLSWNVNDPNLPALATEAPNDVPLLYIVNPDNNEGETFAVPHKPYNKLQLGLYSAYNGEITLNFSNIDANLYEYLILKDLVTGHAQSLLDVTYYTFTHEAGEAPLRFVLQMKLKNKDILETPVINQQVKVTQSGSQLGLHSTHAAFVNVVVYDISGRLVDAQVENNSDKEVTLHLPQPGTYVVHWQMNDGSYATRKVLY